MKRMRIRFGCLLCLVGIFLLPGCVPEDSGSLEINPRFSINLKRLGPAVLNGYPQCADLESDLEETGKLLANLTIAREKYYYDVVTTSSSSATETHVEGESNTAGQVNVIDLSSESGTVESSDTSSAVLADEDNSSEFGTNNQVTGVDEADIVKTDGNFIYLAYGGEVVVHDLEGNILDRQTIPELSLEDASRFKSRLSGLSVVEGNPESVDSENSQPDITIYDPQDRISALLLDQNRLLVIASGYNYENPISDYTRLVLYEVDTEGKLTLLEEETTQGSYQAARELDGTAHVVRAEAGAVGRPDGRQGGGRGRDGRAHRPDLRCWDVPEGADGRL